MDKEKLGQEPAFPCDHVEAKSMYPDGMSKRFYAAYVAMQGMLANMDFLKINDEMAKTNKISPDEFLALTAYNIAD